MYKLLLFVLIGSLMSLQAGVLWEQLPDGSGDNFVDQEFPDLPTYSTYQVHDVTVGPGGWVIDSITGFYTAGFGLWPSVADVRINIFSKTGALPVAGDDPAGGAVYSAALSVDGSGYTEVTAGGLGIALGPGNYWIGMTPMLAFGTYLQEFHEINAAIVGDPSGVRNPGGGFGFPAGTDWFSLTSNLTGLPSDGAILIQGTAGPSGVPEPAAYILMAAGLSALGLLRRRL